MSSAPHTLNCPLCRREMQKTSPATWWCQYDRVVLTCRSSAGAEHRYALQLPGESRTEEPAAPTVPEPAAPTVTAPCPRRLVRLSAIEAKPTDIRIGDLITAHGTLRMVTGLQRAGSCAANRLLLIRGGRGLREQRLVLRDPCLVYRDRDPAAPGRPRPGGPRPTTPRRIAARTQ